MKAESLAMIDGVTDPARKLNLLREYLQTMALRSLHESEAFVRLAFVGGTALRFVFGPSSTVSKIGSFIINELRQQP